MTVRLYAALVVAHAVLEAGVEFFAVSSETLSVERWDSRFPGVVGGGGARNAIRNRERQLIECKPDLQRLPTGLQHHDVALVGEVYLLVAGGARWRLDRAVAAVADEAALP